MTFDDLHQLFLEDQALTHHQRAVISEAMEQCRAVVTEAVRMRRCTDMSPVANGALRRKARFLADEAALMCERRWWHPEQYKPLADRASVRQREALKQITRALNLVAVKTNPLFRAT